MDPVSEEEAIPTIQRALSQLARDMRARLRNKQDFDEEVQELTTAYAERDTELAQRITANTAIVVAVVTAHYKHIFPRLKERQLREGVLKVRDATSFPFDAKKAEEWLRERGLWRDNSTPQPRKIDKPKIEKDKALVDQMPDDIARFVTVERLTIKLPDPQLSDVKEDLPPLREEIKKPDPSN